tara:strand:+ start:2016 stop:2441 length:426 start_codon:yes stop_codon:yes gene_type:complete
MDAQFYQTKEQAVEAAELLIESNDLTGVLRPSAIVQTITLNQIHASMINGDDRRAYMVLWPEDTDLVSYHYEANQQRMEIDGRYAELKQKIAEMEAANEWLLSTGVPTESADKVLVAEAPADSFALEQSATGHIEVKHHSW